MTSFILDMVLFFLVENTLTGHFIKYTVSDWTPFFPSEMH